MGIMGKLNTRYSIVDLIILCPALLLVYLESRTMGWEPIIIAMTIIGLSILIFLLLRKFIIRALTERTIKKRINTTEVSSDDQLANRYKDPEFWFFVLLVVLVVVIIPSFLLIFFGFGSVFIAGITIIIISTIGTVIKTEVPWPSRMTKRNLGFEIEKKGKIIIW